MQPNGWCTTSVHQMGYPFIFNGGLQIFKYLELLTINCISFNILEIIFPNLELSAYKILLPQQVIKISHAHDENALFSVNAKPRTQAPGEEESLVHTVCTCARAMNVYLNNVMENTHQSLHS